MLSSSGLARRTPIRRPWLRTECGVELIRPKVACARIRSSGCLRALVYPGQHVHPEFDVVALERADLGLVLAGQVAEVLVLDPDDVRIAQRKVDVEGHESAQRRQVAVGIGHYLAAAVEQVLADTEQQCAEDGLLAGEVAVDRRPADARRGPEILQGHAVEALKGEERSGGGQKGLPPVRLGLAALCVGGRGWRLPGLTAAPGGLAGLGHRRIPSVANGPCVGHHS